MIRKTYDYSNVYLVPKPSSVNKASEVDLSVRLSEDIKLDIPIIASPMKGITGPAIVSGMANNGSIGIIHRFQKEEEVKKSIQVSLSAMYKDIVYFGIAIGLEDRRYEMALDYGASVICIDVANGYLDSVKHFCERVANHISIYSYDCLLMSGNVVTYDGVKDLSDVGVRLIRIGIGTGNLCTTRQATGVGYGQITALENCAYAKPDYIKLVADGGIKNSGDVVKALAAGADLVMIGSLLGHIYESEHNGEIYGMASRKLQEDFYHQVRSVEGTIQSMEKTTSLDDFLSEFVYGIKHGFTYLGVNNIQDLQRSAEFVEIE